MQKDNPANLESMRMMDEDNLQHTHYIRLEEKHLKESIL